MHHVRRSSVLLHVVALIFVLAHLALHSAAEHILGSEHDSKQALRELFTSLDSDGDGQIREAEASMYIKTLTGHAAKLVKEEAEQLMASLDGSDTDDTISIEELEKSLGLRGQGFSVGQWMEFGLELPQYREAFTTNAVTVVDFPLILKQPELLQQDLGVTSVLHRRQISRAIRNFALGIGTPPQPVRDVLHESTADGSVAISWQLPAQVSRPPVRRVVVSRSCEDAGCSWEVIGSVPADAVVFLDTDAMHPPSRLRYRVTNWSTYGRSEHAFSVASIPQPQSPAPTAESALIYESLELSRAPSCTDRMYWKHMWDSRMADSIIPAEAPSIHSSPRDMEENKPMASLVRFLTGIVVTGAAGVLLLQLLPAFAAPPLMADDQKPVKAPSSNVECHDLSHPPNLPSSTFCGTVTSWLRTVSFGASARYEHICQEDAELGTYAASKGSKGSGRSSNSLPDSGAGLAGLRGHCSTDPGSHSCPQLHRRAATSSRDSLPPCVSPSPGSPRGVRHAVSAHDLAQIGAPIGGYSNITAPAKPRVGAPLKGSWEPHPVQRSMSPLHSKGPRCTAPDVVAGDPPKNGHRSSSMRPSASCEDMKQSPAAASAAVAAADSASPVPGKRRKVPRLGADSMSSPLVRRKTKRHGQCTIEGCMYRPWSMLSAAMLHSTAEFHHCSRCQSDFCVNHMAWITHEKSLLGKCPLDARCICELCWIELRRHGTPVPSIGRAPQKTASFLARMHAEAEVHSSDTGHAIPVAKSMTSPPSTVASDMAAVDGDLEIPASVTEDTEPAGVKRARLRGKLYQFFKRK